MSVLKPTGTGKPLIKSSKGLPPAILSTKGISILVCGAVLGIALLKADPKDIPKIVEIIFGSNTACVIGWTLAVVFLLVGALCVKLQGFWHQKEITRLTTERDYLQERLLKTPSNE